MFDLAFARVEDQSDYNPTEKHEMAGLSTTKVGLELIEAIVYLARYALGNHACLFLV